MTCVGSLVKINCVARSQTKSSYSATLYKLKFNLLTIWVSLNRLGGPPASHWSFIRLRYEDIRASTYWWLRRPSSVRTSTRLSWRNSVMWEVDIAISMLDAKFIYFRHWHRLPGPSWPIKLVKWPILCFLSFSWSWANCQVMCKMF